MIKKYYDLGFAFRKTKIWKKIYEEELFAVKLAQKVKPETGKNIGYCCLMGRNSEHMALAVYIGAEGLTSYRKMFGQEPDVLTDYSDLLIQDCVQCSIEKRDQFSSEELYKIKNYCDKAGIGFRAPFPQFTRFKPYCIPWEVKDRSDWNAIEKALQVVVKMAEVIAESGKDALGLRPISLGLHDQSYAPEQLGLFRDLPVDEVTIPLYSIVDGKLVSESLPLPPYMEKPFTPPTRMNDIAVAKMMKRAQKGTYECEIVRLPEPVDGQPPFVPAVLVTVDEDGLVLKPVMASAPAYDPDEMLDGFVESLGDAYPRTIKVRTEETRILLENFCRRAKIHLEETENLWAIDDAVNSMTDYFSEGCGDEVDMLETMSMMLEDLSPEEIALMSDILSDQILDLADFFPESIVRKVRRARERKEKE